MYVLIIPYATSAKWDAFYGVMYFMQQHGAVSMSFRH